MVELSKNDFDLLLRLAADRVMASDVEQFALIDTTGITISEKTENKILRMIRRSRTADTRKIWIRSLQRVAIIVLVVITATFTAAMCIEPIRAAFVDAVITWYDDYISILFIEDNQDSPTTIEAIYTFDNLPEGWTIKQLSCTERNVIHLALNINGEEILIQQKVNDNNDILIDNTKCIEQNIKLSDGNYATLFEYSDGRTILMWSDLYTVVLSGTNVDSDLLVHFANNIIK